MTLLLESIYSEEQLYPLRLAQFMTEIGLVAKEQQPFFEEYLREVKI